MRLTGGENNASILINFTLKAPIAEPIEEYKEQEKKQKSKTKDAKIYKGSHISETLNEELELKIKFPLSKDEAIIGSEYRWQRKLRTFEVQKTDLKIEW